MKAIRLSERPELWPASLVPGRAALAEPNEQLEHALQARGFEILGLEGLGADDMLVIPQSALEDLVALVDRLLGPGGCPWDQAQTHESLKRHLLEEAYELFDAIDSKEVDAIREEVGDVLLQPIMHGQMAAGFDTQAAARAAVDKLVRRHPHVFGDVDAPDAESVLRNWDRIKAVEKGEAQSVLAGVPAGMASLLRAYEVSKRAARSGFEWPNLDGVWDKLREEEAELRKAADSGDRDHIEAEIGDLLFTVVNLARWLKVEPEEALRKMLNRFTQRFSWMELESGKPLSELSALEWDDLWNRAKALEP